VGPNVYVKIPITNTKGESAVPLLRRLASTGVRTNVTAIFTQAQIQAASDSLADAAPCNISVFAGRIADAGEDPLPIMRRALEIMRPHPHQELIWASPREVYNVVQSHDIGCHIIAVTADLLAKLPNLGKDLANSPWRR
jgi:transaldolase